MSLFSLNPEQRYHPRLKLALPVAFLFDSEQVIAKTHDLSCGGVYVAGNQNELAIGQKLIVRLYIPEFDKTLKFNGLVCRHESMPQEKTSATQKPTGVAVKFEGLYDDNFLEVDRYVKWQLAKPNSTTKL